MSKSNIGGDAANPTSRLLSEKEVAHLAGVSTSWLQKLRMNGSGPQFYKLGKTVRYSSGDVQHWLDSLKA